MKAIFFALSMFLSLTVFAGLSEDYHALQNSGKKL